MLLAAGAGLILAMRVRAAVPDDGFALLGRPPRPPSSAAPARTGGAAGCSAPCSRPASCSWPRSGSGWSRPSRGPGRRCSAGRSCSACWSGGWSRRPAAPSRRRRTTAAEDAGPETQLWDPYGTGSFARPGTDPYPTGGFTPAASYREGAEPYWPGQAPAPEDEPAAAEPTRDLGGYREPGEQRRAVPGAGPRHRAVTAPDDRALARPVLGRDDVRGGRGPARRPGPAHPVGGARLPTRSARRSRSSWSCCSTPGRSRPAACSTGC